jgi:hypothetical protein
MEREWKNDGGDVGWWKKKVIVGPQVGVKNIDKMVAR